MDTVYIHTEIVHNFKAAEEVVPFLIEKFYPASIIDIGCGIGTWLKVAKGLGIKEVLGVDGNYVDRNLLKIKEKEFVAKDLCSFFSLEKKFDLALCLEVAEHLPEQSAAELISTLCAHSNIIVFSAAIPNQGGQNHINEQWPSYWENLFLKHGYKGYDILRPVFWNNQNVDYWYRQNMLIFSSINLSGINSMENSQLLNSYIHPDLFESKLSEIKSYVKGFESFRNDPGILKAAGMLVKSFKRKFWI